MKSLKKNISIIVLLIISLVMVSCTSTKEEVSGNDKFISAFEKSINGRWTEQNKLGEKASKYTEQEYNNENIKIIEKEVTTLEEVKVGIDDVNLKKIADEYIEGNKLQIEAMKSNDFMVSSEYTSKSDSLRKPALIAMVDTYGVVIKEEHQQTYKDFKAQAIVIEKENKSNSYAEALINEMKFEKTVDEFGYVKFTAIVENTSDIDFKNISYNVQYKDKDGVVIDNGYLSLDNFTPGSKQKVELSAYSKETESFSLVVNYVNVK